MSPVTEGFSFSGEGYFRAGMVVAAALAVAASLPVQAVPVVDTCSVTGNLITAGGPGGANGFGATGPNIVLYDDFNAGGPAAGAAVPLNSPRVGAWTVNASDRFNPIEPIYDARGVSVVVAGDTDFAMAVTDPSVNRNRARFFQLPNVDETQLFVSYWAKFPGIFPGAAVGSGDDPPAGFGTISSLKTVWIGDGVFFEDGNDDWTLLNYTGNQFSLFRNDAPAAPNTANQTLNGVMSLDNLDNFSQTHFSLRRYNRVSVWLDAGPGPLINAAQTGSVFIQNLQNGGGITLTATATNFELFNENEDRCCVALPTDCIDAIAPDFSTNANPNCNCLSTPGFDGAACDEGNVPGDRKRWNTLAIPGFLRFQDSTGTPYPAGTGPELLIDDFYVATGPNAQARMEIGDAPVYGNAQRLSIVPAEAGDVAGTSWSDTQVIGRAISTGPFQDDLRSLYVFIVDAAGQVSNGCFLGTADGLPTPPTSLN